jgi:hypothetical protein
MAATETSDGKYAHKYTLVVPDVSFVSFSTRLIGSLDRPRILSNQEPQERRRAYIRQGDHIIKVSFKSDSPKLPEVIAQSLGTDGIRFYEPNNPLLVELPDPEMN